VVIFGEAKRSPLRETFGEKSEVFILFGGPMGRQEKLIILTKYILNEDVEEILFRSRWG
jgi:hypothetical protein